MSILKEGYPFIIPSFLGGSMFFVLPRFIQHIHNSLPLSIACVVIGSLLLLFGFFCMFFFRDPKISITQGDNIILSPCNGTVLEVTEEGNEKVIRIFLSVFSVHLQRSPVDGDVVDITHKPGKFLAAWNPRAHIENEQNIISIHSESGIFVVRQIAGLLARRCVAWVKPGDSLTAGKKIGMIKFSSQVDLHLPRSATVVVQPGEKTKAGITIVATK